jgi:hypothetical protein
MKLLLCRQIHKNEWLETETSTSARFVAIIRGFVKFKFDEML